MEKENKIEELKELLENMSDDDIIYVWNEYCDANSYYDDRINYMDWLNNDLEGRTPTQIIDMIDKDFYTDDKYYKYTIYGIESFDDASDVVYFDDLANYILDNDDDLGNSEIRIFLDETEEEGEEE